MFLMPQKFPMPEIMSDSHRSKALIDDVAWLEWNHGNNRTITGEFTADMRQKHEKGETLSQVIIDALYDPRTEKLAREIANKVLKLIQL